MSIFSRMLETSNYSLFDEKEDALILMRDLINEMISELDTNKRLIDMYLEDMENFPLNHKLSLENNDDFYILYNKYHDIISKQL